jgi:hypothetical protein
MTHLKIMSPRATDDGRRLLFYDVARALGSHTFAITRWPLTSLPSFTFEMSIAIGTWIHSFVPTTPSISLSLDPIGVAVKLTSESKV